MSNFRIEISHPGFQEFKFTFTVKANLSDTQIPSIFADRTSIENLSRALSKASSAVNDSLDLINFASTQRDIDDNVVVSSISLEGEPFSLSKYLVIIDDDAKPIMAPNYPSATLLASLKRIFEGKSFEKLLQNHNSISNSIEMQRNERNAYSYKEPILYEGVILPWHILEKSQELLTEEQLKPFNYTLCQGSYGYLELFEKDGVEWSFAKEIDFGVVVSRGYLPEMDEVTIESRLGREMAQVNIGIPFADHSFNIYADHICSKTDGKLTEDGDYKPSMSP